MAAQDSIIVIGGGPAGSCAATLLARRGYPVVLLERERFPRGHIGESLLPASIPILRELGAPEAVERPGPTNLNLYGGKPERLSIVRSVQRTAAAQRQHNDRQRHGWRDF